MSSAYPPSYNSYGNPFESTTDVRRSPQPPMPGSPPLTQDEMDEDNMSLIDWKSMRSWRFWARKEWIPWYIIGFLLALLTTLITIYHKQIVTWLTPAANWMRDLPAGWLIPIAILFVISFPPLFGHEIVAVLCGVVWGLWVGFAIVAAGTFVGEVGNFYAFKYCCHARSEKMEKTKPWYACLAKVVRDGGFKIALIVRLSAIPGHFTTAVFATCGMSIWTFCLAAILSSPKQFVTVYLGYILDQTSSTEPTSSKVASDLLVVLSLIITVFAAWYIYKKMLQVRPEIIRARRQQMRAYKLSLTAPSQENLWSTNEFNPSELDVSKPSYTPSRSPNRSPYPSQDPYAAPLYDSRGSSRNASPVLPSGAAPPGGYVPSQAGYAAPNTGRGTPSGAGPRGYNPPRPQAYGASSENLPLEPMQVPSGLDPGISSYNLYVPPTGPPPRFQQQQQQQQQPYPMQQPYLAAPQPQPARFPPPPEPSLPPQYHAPADLRNPFEEPPQEKKELPYQLGDIQRVASPTGVPPPPQAGEPMQSGAPPAPFQVHTMGSDKPRGVQLRDG